MLAIIDDWRAFLDSALTEEHMCDLRNHTRTGRPLGNTPFIERLENLLGRVLRPQKRGRKRKFPKLPNCVLCPLPERVFCVKEGLLPERVFCVKEGLRRFCLFFRGGFLGYVCTFHAGRTDGFQKGFAMRWFAPRSSRLLSGKTLVCSNNVRSLRNSSARSLRSFFSWCDRASTHPFVASRGRFVMPALGLDLPDTYKINSTVPRTSSSLHNQDYARTQRADPKGRVKGTRRADLEPWGFARSRGESTPSHRLRCFSHALASLYGKLP